MADKAINENVNMMVVLEVYLGCILDKNVAEKKHFPLCYYFTTWLCLFYFVQIL